MNEKYVNLVFNGRKCKKKNEIQGSDMLKTGNSPDGLVHLGEIRF